MGAHGGNRPLGNEPQEIAPAKASGGTETVIEQNGLYYRVHSFTTVGSSTLSVSRGGEVEYLIVAGGGAGGTTGGGGTTTGGGGAGGCIKNVIGEQDNNETLSSVTPSSYSVIVGDGLAFSSAENTGEDSSIFGLVAKGGGRGGTHNGNGFVGGSGGGGGGNSGDGAAGVEGQGNAGADGTTLTIDGRNDALTWVAGGGGGAKTAGVKATGTTLSPSDITRPNGGDGVESSITGTSAYYAGGGGGGASGFTLPGFGGLGGGGDGGSSGQNGDNAENNTGGGGGGFGRNSGQIAGNGGSGIVIVRYRITEFEYNQEV